MEKKKSESADLNAGRTTGFLLGLILSFAVLFVCLEYTSRPQGDERGELVPVRMTEDDMLSFPAMEKPPGSAPSAGPSSAMTEKVKVARAEEDGMTEKLPPESNALRSGEEENFSGTAVNEKVASLDIVPAEESARPLSVRVVEQLPVFPGGPSMFMKWLTKEIRYPEYARENRIEGKVIVSFIVNKDGSVADIRIVRSAQAYLDMEALRVMHRMPRWQPGVCGNQPCRTMVVVPVVFKL